RTHGEIAALDHAVAVLVARWMHVYLLPIADRTNATSVPKEWVKVNATARMSRQHRMPAG
ncbi:MAG: hypothetical protein ACXVDA_04355, partial [Ktedonobacterales bacterium]